MLSSLLNEFNKLEGRIVLSRGYAGLQFLEVSKVQAFVLGLAGLAWQEFIALYKSLTKGSAGQFGPCLSLDE